MPCPRRPYNAARQRLDRELASFSPLNDTNVDSKDSKGIPFRPAETR